MLSYVTAKHAVLGITKTAGEVSNAIAPAYKPPLLPMH
jgi:hypothetical protein